MAAEIQILITALIGLLVVFGGGIKWMLMYIDGKQTKSSLNEADARVALSTMLHEEIRILRQELAISNATIAESNATSKFYLRRIYQLESFIHTQAGISIPTMEGWPPV